MKHPVSLTTFAIVLALLHSAADATVYYVDSSAGNDTNAGTNSSAPWKSIARVNASTLSAGDAVLFKNGGIWREQLIVPASGVPGNPITFGAYGTSGQKPVISGADLISPSAWNQFNGSIYVASVGPMDSAAQVYVDGMFCEIARYPDNGWLSVTAASHDTTHVIDANLGLSAAQVVGTTLVARTASHAIASAPIGAYVASTGTLTTASALSAPIPYGYGFYLRNASWMIDRPAEWSYDSTTGNLYLRTPASDSPAGHTVEITRRPYGIYAQGLSNLTFQGLSVMYATKADIEIDNVRGALVSSVDTRGGAVGINLMGDTSPQVLNSSSQSALQIGIKAAGPGTVLSGNHIDGTGTVAAMPDVTSYGIFMGGNSSSASGNTITDVGYAAISFGGPNMTVQNNVIDGACLMLDDCGAIYTWSGDPANTNTGIVVAGNTISNVIGNASGTPQTQTLTSGIYLDNFSHDVQLQANKVDNADYGILLHNNYGDSVTSNVVHNARDSALLIQNDSTAGYVHDNSVTGNVLESLGIGWTALALKDFKGTTVAFGHYDSNLYCHAGSSYAIYQASLGGSAYYILPAWRTATGQDLSSTEVAAACPNG